MIARAQRLRVAELLDGLACQREWIRNTHDLLSWGSDDDKLACRAWKQAYGADTWRDRYRKAAQLLREGSVK